MNPSSGWWWYRNGDSYISQDCEIFEGLRAFAYDIKVKIAHKCKSALAGGKTVNSCQNVVKNKKRLFS